MHTIMCSVKKVSCLLVQEKLGGLLLSKIMCTGAAKKIAKACPIYCTMKYYKQLALSSAQGQ